MEKSKAGRFYKRGKLLQEELQCRIIDNFGEGKSVEKISKLTSMDIRTVNKTIQRYMHTGTITDKPYRRPAVLVNENILTAIEIITKKLCFKRKKLTIKAKEGLTDQVQAKFDLFLHNIENINPFSIHCFDEASVVLTTGNRKYGYSLPSERAFEIQRYASNANYTINLMQSPLGIDYFNIIDGPSNGLHLLNFFINALQETDVHGNAFLTPGDVVVMDNCGFHHGRFTEANLRNILQQHGIRLVFQPPYHPELNTCELSFSKIKSFLRRFPDYLHEYTELAICDAVNDISRSDCFGYFQHCGYM
ncbi:unnamed protein product [Mytilus edulis]|uniref:Tc1-like transposase DDE domain-containing protein n=1 Tax=Mytilus edulis TaxID=6550 RepID=A0A8S3UTL4_MYTED|nr:unnamed protein product [Mytilus edulis]